MRWIPILLNGNFEGRNHENYFTSEPDRVAPGRGGQGLQVAASSVPKGPFLTPQHDSKVSKLEP